MADDAMEINRSDVLAAVTEAFYRYEKALTGNDVETLDALFWRDEKTVRLGATENLFGHSEILAFRKARLSKGLDRTLGRTEITTFGDSFATASTTFTRESEPRTGRQSQSWVWFGADAGWKIVAAHVSWMDE